MVRTQVQLTEEQVRWLRGMAAERGVSLAEVIREAVDEHLRRAAGPTRQELKRRAREIAGMFDSGTPDLVERLDDHLVEAYEAEQRTT